MHHDGDVSLRVSKTESMSVHSSQGGNEGSGSILGITAATLWEASVRPEVAAAIDGRLERERQSQKTEIDSVLEPIKAEKAKAAVEENYAVMDKDFPGWRKRVATPEFGEWLDKQPAAVRDLAASDAVEDAASLVTYYDTHLRASGKEIDLGKTDVDEDGKTATDLEKRRARQLENGRTVSSRASGVNSGADEEGDDFSRAFALHAGRKARQQAQA